MHAAADVHVDVVRRQDCSWVVRRELETRQPFGTLILRDRAATLVGGIEPRNEIGVAAATTAATSATSAPCVSSASAIARGFAALSAGSPPAAAAAVLDC